MLYTIYERELDVETGCSPLISLCQFCRCSLTPCVALVCSSIPPLSHWPLRVECLQAHLLLWPPELPEGARLDLAHSLLWQLEDGADLLKGALVAPLEAVAHAEDLALERLERREQRVVDLFLEQTLVERGLGLGRLEVGVGVRGGGIFLFGWFYYAFFLF